MPINWILGHKPQHEVCVRIQLGYTCKPYVCTRIFIPKNPNLNLFCFRFFILLIQYASTMSFFMLMSLYLHVLFVVCSSHVRLEFLFYSLFDMP